MPRKAKATPMAEINPVVGDEPSKPANSKLNRREVQFKDIVEEAENVDMSNEPAANDSGKRVRKPPVKYVSDPIRGAKKPTSSKRMTKSTPLEEESGGKKPNPTGRKRKTVEETLEEESEELPTSKSDSNEKVDKKETKKTKETKTSGKPEEEAAASGKANKKVPTKKGAKAEGNGKAAPVENAVNTKKAEPRGAKKKATVEEEPAPASSGDDENEKETSEVNSEAEEPVEKPKTKRAAAKKVETKPEPVAKTSGRVARGAKKRNVEEAEPAAEENSDEAAEPEVVAKPKKGRKDAKSSKGDKANNETKEQTGTKRKKIASTDKQIRIASWNVAGIRACLTKYNGINDLMNENVDILCLQELKAQQDQVSKASMERFADYHCYWNSPSDKKGYSGVAVLSKFKPISVSKGLGDEEFDQEGRIITLEFDNFYLINVYIPNAGEGLKRLEFKVKWDELFRNYMCELDSMKPVIACGDFNVAHQEIDLAHPKTNTKHAGFTPEEREDFTKLLDEGFVDTFRELYPDRTEAYTFWSRRTNARPRNVGWRLDYFVVSERINDCYEDNIILSEIDGSDHCPIMLLLNLSPSD